MKLTISLLLTFLCLSTFGQLDYKAERRIRAEEDSIRKADTIARNFRMIKRIKYGVITTFSQGNYSVIGLGFNRIVTGAVGQHGFRLNYDKNLNNRMHGLNLGLFATAKGNGLHLFARGGPFNYLTAELNCGVYSDLSLTTFFCIKPEIGFDFMHFILTYSYTWTQPKKNTELQNTHAINLKYYLTFYTKKQALLYDW